MKKSTKQQELADKIARLKAGKGQVVEGVNAADDHVKHAKVVNSTAKKQTQTRAMKPMKNMSSGRKG